MEATNLVDSRLFIILGEGKRKIAGKKKKIKSYEDYFKSKKDSEGNGGDFLKKYNLELREAEMPRKSPVTRDNQQRLIIGFFILLFLIVLLVFRLGYWQVIKSDELKDKALAMQKLDTEIDSVRGNIYDSRMNALAETSTEYELYGYTQSLYKNPEKTETEKEVILNNLVKITGEDKDDLLHRINGKDNLAFLADGLTKDDINKAKKMWGTDIFVKTKVTRSYPNGSFAAQLLGGVNEDNTGRTGLEYEYNTELAGVKGRTVKTTDNAGNTLADGSSKYYKAKAGESLVTTIDSVVQHYAEDALEHGMKRTGASSITCLVMNPKTGDIIAAAQTPEYDPNESNRPSKKSEYESFKKMSKDKQTEYLSRMWTLESVSSIYEPGSTFKLIASAAVLESGSATMNSTYYCNGGITVNGTRLGCLASHGTQELKIAVSHSCNSAFARVALDMGSNTFYNYIDLFGFRDKTDVDLPGETNSIVKDPNNMGEVDLATTGYGQGIAITPIQMLSAVNAIGNGGYLMQPKVVKKIINKNGRTIKKFDDVIVRQAISKETSDLMKDIMEYYPTQMGGNYAYVPGYRVGGKTGTANIANAGGYSDSTDCSYVAMAPMDNPKISVLVIVHKPTKTQYGNASAGPIVKEIIEKSLMYYGVERKYTDKEAQDAKKDKVIVPNLIGMDSKKAVAELTKKGLRYQFVPDEGTEKSFIVADQYPKKGKKTSKKSIVYLYRE